MVLPQLSERGSPEVTRESVRAPSALQDTAVCSPECGSPNQSHTQKPATSHSIKYP